jgi:hypothetical protein
MMTTAPLHSSVQLLKCPGSDHPYNVEEM